MKKSVRILSVAAGTVVLLSMLPITTSAASEDTGTVRVIVRNDTFSKENGAAWDGVLLDEYVKLDSDTNAFSALVQAIESKGYTCEGADSGYITAINGLSASDSGSMGGWMGAIDDWIADNSLSAFSVSAGTLEDGDEISFEYSCSWGSDLRYDWSGTDTSLLELAVNGGTLSPEFSAGDLTYTLTIPSDTADIQITPKTVNRNYRSKIYKNTYTPAESGTDYKFGKNITVTEGDVIFVGVGNAAWASFAPDGVTETVYQISVNKETEVIDTDVQSVISLIEAINPDELNRSDVEKARAAYDSLTAEQQAQITNYSKLEEAEEKLSSEPKAETKTISVSAIKEMVKARYTDAGIAGNEWQIITLARYDLLDDETKAKYEESVKTYLDTVGSAKLSETMSTTNSRFVLALTAAGIDPTNIGGYDLVEPLTDYDYVSKQGTNGIFYALLALDSHGYGDTAVREKYVDAILSEQLSDGGWTLYGEESDVDVTAMALQALAPYQNDEKVGSAVDKALAYLSETQNEDGSFSSYGSANAESTSQAIIALTALHIDVTEDSRFIKNGNTVINGLALFLTDDNGFAHTAGGEQNALSTSQAYLAVTALYRSENKLSALYDMNDISFDSRKDDIDESSEPVSSNDTGKTSEPSNNTSTSSGSSTVTATTASVTSSTSTSTVSAASVNTGDTQGSAVIVLTILSASAALYLAMRKKPSTK